MLSVGQVHNVRKEERTDRHKKEQQDNKHSGPSPNPGVLQGPSTESLREASGGKRVVFDPNNIHGFCPVPNSQERERALARHQQARYAWVKPLGTGRVFLLPLDASEDGTFVFC